MKIKESSIEKKIRLNTPCYVYGVSENISRYNCEFFNIRVYFKNGFTVHKGVSDDGLVEHSSCVPDFILLNKHDKEVVDSLCKAFENGGISEYTLNDYFCSRKNLYFIEAFGDYWHDKEITGVEKSEHEEEVVKSYREAGHKVLVLWEHDIVNAWEEKCMPLIRQFIDEFVKDGNVLPDEDNDVSTIVDGLSDNAIQFMHDIEYRRSLSKEDMDSVSKEIAEFYRVHGLFNVNRYDSLLDYNRVQKWSAGNLINVTRFGKVFPWYFFDTLKTSIKNDSGVCLSDFVCSGGDSVFNAVVSLIGGDSDINMVSVLAEVIRQNGFKTGLPFDFAEIIMRVQRISKSFRSVFFDPLCNYGETLLAAKALGFKKYIGFVESKERKDEIVQFARFIGYERAEIYVADYDSRLLMMSILKDGMFIFSCCDDMEKFSKILWIIENGHMISLGTRMKDFRAIPEKVCVFRLVYLNKCDELENNVYELRKNDGYNYVRCLECGLSFSSLRGHLLDAHGMTTDEYVTMHPGSSVTSKSEHDKIVCSNKSKYGGVKKKYGKRYVYLMPDGGYASKADKYKRAWGVDKVKKEHIVDASIIDYMPDYAKKVESGKEGEDYVCCAICGAKKGSLTQHLRKEHRMTVEQYEKRYHAPVYSRKTQEAFHNCAVNKWKTQFETGKSVRAVPKEKVENPMNRKRDDITKEMILEQFEKGVGTTDMGKVFDCSDVTLLKYINLYGIEVPSRTVLAIRRAVHDGAEYDLEHVGIDIVDRILSIYGKEKTMAMFGVRRTVFDTWVGQLRDAKSRELEERMKRKKNDTGKQTQCLLFENEEPDEQTICDYVKQFQQAGFPYPFYSDEEALKIIGKVIHTKQMIDDEGNIASGGSSGTELLLSFFPHFFDCSQNGDKSAVWYFENKLDHIVKDMMKYGKGRAMTAGLLRSCLMEHERVTGFRPVIAKQIYDRHCCEGAKVLDPCGGWGGRMLGAYCSDKVARYDCVDASSKTCDGLAKLSSKLDEIYHKKDCSVIHGAFEDVRLEYGLYDAVFTSPPYFSKEIYSDDSEQSCVRYHDYDGWLDGFLKPFVHKSFTCLKSGGKLIVNIDDVTISNKTYPLKYDLEQCAYATGFSLRERMFMHYRNRYSGDSHGEPIYVFVKK